MPDEWEIRYGLDPKDASDAAKDNAAAGYPNSEEYLNGTSRLTPRLRRERKQHDT